MELFSDWFWKEDADFWRLARIKKVEFLIQAGADIALQNNNDKISCHIATEYILPDEKKRDRIIELLIY
jgi:hypothetical protein